MNRRCLPPGCAEVRDDLGDEVLERDHGKERDAEDQKSGDEGLGGKHVHGSQSCQGWSSSK